MAYQAKDEIQQVKDRNLTENFIKGRKKNDMANNYQRPYRTSWCNVKRGLAMGWIAVDKNGFAWVYEVKPKREARRWVSKGHPSFLFSDVRGIRTLIGRELTWEDEPVEIKKNDNENIVFKGNGDSTKGVAIAFRQLYEDIIKFGEMGQSYWNVSLRGNKNILRSRAKQIVMRARILQEIVNSYTEE